MTEPGADRVAFAAAIRSEHELARPGEPETRFTRFPPDIVQRDEGGPLLIRGYAVAWGKLSRGTVGFAEQIVPGAFDEDRAGGWPGVTASFGGQLIGTTAAGTLTLTADSTGLMYEAEPEPGSPVLEPVRSGDIRHARFTFRVRPGGSDTGPSEFGCPLRTLLSIELLGIRLLHIREMRRAQHDRAR